MPKIWEPGRKEALLMRLEALRPDTRPQWGQFTPSRMLLHCAAGMEMALGEREVAPKISIMAAWPVKKLVIYAMPWPKGAPTAPELLFSEADDPGFAAAKERFSGALDRVVAACQDRDFLFAPHAAFGPLSPSDWASLTHKHIDHHWKQFGL